MPGEPQRGGAGHEVLTAACPDRDPCIGGPTRAPARTWAPSLLLLCSVLLGGCGEDSHYRLVSHPSVNQDERVRFLILHYTDEDDAVSLRVLTDEAYGVSTHYLVPSETAARPYPVLQLVPDDRRAWHAGRSRWGDEAGLNAGSLGVEIVNGGFPAEDAALPLDRRRWQPFGERQLQAVGALTRDLVDRYQIPPTHVLGHSDVAPGRKLDPGPRFPWQRLHQELGVGAWPDEARVAALLAEPAPEEAAPWQQALKRYGYDVPDSGEWDEQTRSVLSAFQLHFRAARADGLPDSECWARLNALLERYHSQE
jgi:N-acetylmuramoyl-L-alanine amidase